MLSSIWIASLLGSLALAAPSYGAWEIPLRQDNGAISDYFNSLAARVLERKQMSDMAICDLSRAVMPSTSPSLPGPSTGLVPFHIAIGRGTQNYTCGSNATAAPVSAGALATLYNVSCIASTSPTVLATLPNFALQFNVTSNKASSNVANIFSSGIHLFTDLTTPFFDLDTSDMMLGQVPCAKNNTSPAPSGSPKGQGGVGFGSVPWLKLIAKSSATNGIQEVYRLNTAGGSPPATCAGMPATFEIPYAAEYWFYRSL